MQNRIIKTKHRRMAILSVLKSWHDVCPGFWYGYAELLAQLKDVHGIELTAEQARKLLKELKAAGLVKTEAVFSEQTGRLNGTGWFYVAP